jgi:hypothetical protein
MMLKVKEIISRKNLKQSTFIDEPLLSVLSTFLLAMLSCSSCYIKPLCPTTQICQETTGLIGFTG